MPKQLLRYAFDDQAFRGFRATQIQVKLTTSNWERQRYFALRQRVFSDEQQLLSQEQDAEDFRATAIVALASNCGMTDDVVGAVRIFQRADPDYPDLWFGGRLCVAKEYRGHRQIGKALINTAVSRAKQLGCQHFHAFVQRQNVRYFSSLHWSEMGDLCIAGLPHKRMRADLSAYPLASMAPPMLAETLEELA